MYFKCSLYNLFQGKLFEFQTNALIGIKDINNYFTIIYAFLAFAIYSAITGYLFKISKEMFNQDIRLNVKSKLFNKYIGMNYNKFTKTNLGTKTSILTNDVDIFMNNYVDLAVNIFYWILILIVGLVSISFKNKVVGIYLVIISLISVFITKLFEEKLNIKQKEVSNNMENSADTMIEYFKGYSVIKSFGITTKIITNFKKITNVKKSALELNSYQTKVGLISEVMTFLAFGGNMLICGYYVYIGKMNYGEFMFCIQMSNNVSHPIALLFDFIPRFRGSKSIKSKLEGILNEEEEEAKGEVVKKIDNGIKFNEVGFSYNNEEYIENLNLDFKKDKKYAIVGFSRSGKSTLLKLIDGELKPKSGEIFIDNRNMEDIDKESLLELISTIGQEVFLFNDTIKNNVGLYNKKFSESEIEKALVKAGLGEFLESKKNGIDELVGEDGNLLSGGERQRISIARAMIRNTPVILADEFTASLDNKTADSVEKNLLELDNKIIIVITHKIGKNIEKYNEIIVMKDGEVVEKGSFDYLMERGKYFKLLYNISN